MINFIITVGVAIISGVAGVFFGMAFEARRTENLENRLKILLEQNRDLKECIALLKSDPEWIEVEFNPERLDNDFKFGGF